MTVQKAIEELNMILEEATAYEHAVCYVTSCDEEPLKMAIEALEKQVSIDRILERLEEIADKSNDMILESDSPQYYDGFEDGVRKAIEIIEEEVQHD